MSEIEARDVFQDLEDLANWIALRSGDHAFLLRSSVQKIEKDFATANATISALEGKLAAAEAIIRRSRAAFVVLSDTLAPRKGGNLAREQIAAIDEWQQENTDNEK